MMKTVKIISKAGLRADVPERAAQVYLARGWKLDVPKESTPARAPAKAKPVKYADVEAVEAEKKV